MLVAQPLIELLPLRFDLLPSGVIDARGNRQVSAWLSSIERGPPDRNASEVSNPDVSASSWLVHSFWPEGGGIVWRGTETPETPR